MPTIAPMATTATPLAFAVEPRSSDKHKLTSTRSERVVLPRPEQAVQHQNHHRIQVSVGRGSSSRSLLCRA